MLKITAKKHNGFTLIEMIIALGISCAVLVGLGSVFLAQQKTRALQKEILTMRQNLRAAMLLMSREIRKAGYDPSGAYNGQAGFTKIYKGRGADDPGQLEFTYYDEKKNQLHNAVIRLFDSSNDPENTKDEIQMKISGQSIAENIAAMNFAFWDENGEETQDPKEVRAVTIFLTARQDEASYTAAEPQTLSMTVTCRNMGL